MTMVCKICCHFNRLEIDRQLVQGAVRLSIAKKYGFTPSSVDYHAKNHLSRQMLKSQEIKNRIDSNVLFTEIETCLTKTKTILKNAEDTNKPSLQLQAIREIRSTIEFLVRLHVDIMKLEQEKEIAENRTGAQVVFLPKISNGMTTKEAADLYLQQIKYANQNPGTVVFLPEEQELIEVQEQSPSKMTRTTKPGSAERVKAAAEAPDQEEDEIDSILDWTPPAPATRTGWPGGRR